MVACRRRCQKRDRPSRVPRAAESTEDLSSDWIIPVTERVTNCAGTRCPRATSQHLVLRAEEFLGILLVRKALKPGIAVEVARCPLPDIADHPITADWRDVALVAVDGRGVE